MKLIFELLHLCGKEPVDTNFPVSVKNTYTCRQEIYCGHPIQFGFGLHPLRGNLVFSLYAKPNLGDILHVLGPSFEAQALA